VFTEQGICPCAGERPEPIDAARIQLTELVHNAGCASKIAPVDLEQVLSRLPKVDDPAILAGIPAGDDAGVYRISDDTVLVQTVDVFTPCVDDPYTFGRICAANCLSDVYAMGGVPRTALSILGFPSETLDGQIMYRMMAGAMAALAEADCALIGGHSIKDEQIMLGFAITGTIRPEATAHDTARVGDRLVLTKPLGVGVLNFCRQIGRPHEAGLAAAERSMATLNRAAAEAMVEVGVSGCTDVTGFGLFGHLIGMVRHSHVTAQVYADALPALPGALEALADDVVPGAIERNREYVADDIEVAEGVDAARVHLGFDAQTSGGLLIAVPSERHEALLAALRDRGVEPITIGRIVGESGGRILVTRRDQAAETAGPVAVDHEDDLPQHAAPSPQAAKAAHEDACCADVFGAEAGEGSAAEAMKAFGALMRATGAGGAIDERTKELINFALVVLARCGPCIDVHLAKARKMGISQAEMDEAAWCAVAMGGAPVKMFYQDALQAERGADADADCCR
jgi:selenide,water dikinase